MDMDPGFSRHAAWRGASRSIPPRVADMVIDHADIDIPVGRGVRSAMVTRRKIGRLKALPLPMREAMADVIVLYVEDDGRIVSVFHDLGRRGRAYRRR